MPRPTLRLLAVCLLPCLAAAQAPPPSNDASDNGFQGPVHTVRIHFQQLAPDPRHKPVLKYDGAGPGDDWRVFDRNGWTTEVGAYVDGELGPLLRFTRDAWGNELERTVDTPQGPRRWHHQVRQGPCGKLEDVETRDGNPAGREVREYDAGCNETVIARYDGEGKLSSRILIQNDAHGRQTEMRAERPDGQVVLRFRRRYDDQGELVSDEEYDHAGNLVRSIGVRHWSLVSWWQDPECHCSGTIGFIVFYDHSVDYYFQPDGSVYTALRTHKGRYSNVEPDELTLRDASGQLLEKVSIEYERDARGNWTSRRISVLDPATGGMVLVRHDTRTLTYY